MAQPITSSEFRQLFRRAIPPLGLSKVLAIANSGGPDSACLLFLVDRFLKESKASAPRLVSLSVDHALQAKSAAMAQHAQSTALSLGIEHRTLVLPWGKDGHPPKPAPTEPMEEVARDMRRASFLKAMLDIDANALAMGHHLDDQVETVFMRLGRGSSRLGLSGMKHCRRWGMGMEHLPNRDRVAGIERFIIRPLLSVGKDRILATCNEHGIEYIKDPTNDDPSLTIRNAVRAILESGGNPGFSSPGGASHALPLDIMKKLESIDKATHSLPSFSLNSSRQSLRNASLTFSGWAAALDTQVDEIISNHRLPSPPGTFLISRDGLQNITGINTREAFLIRIVRYVSPKPWGDPSAELGRRRESLHRLIDHLWNETPKKKGNGSICVGSGVWWKQVVVRGGVLHDESAFHDGPSQSAWIATRQPPIQRASPRDLILDVTQALSDACKHWETRVPGSNRLRVLYDSRFLVTLSIDCLPKQVYDALCDRGSRFLIRPIRPWFLPEVVLSSGTDATVLHSHVDWDYNRSGLKGVDVIKSDWISTQYFRPLSAI